MKNYILYLCSIILPVNCIFFSSSAQESSSVLNIPDYLYAENASPMILVAIHKTINEEVYNRYYSTKQVHVKKDISFYQVDTTVFNSYLNFLKTDLRKLNFNPAGFIDIIDLYIEKKTSVDVDNAIREKLYKNKSRYYMVFSILRAPPAYIVKSGKATREHFRNAIVTINKYNGESIEQIKTFDYLLEQPNQQMLYQYLKNVINYQKKGFFINKIEGEPYYAKAPYKPISQFYKYPDDLDKKQLLVVLPPVETTGDELKNQKIKEIIKNNYPFDYQVVKKEDVTLEIEEAHDYILEPKRIDYYEVKEIRDQFNIPKIVSVPITRVYYQIRDIKEQAVFYGETLDLLEKSAGTRYDVALNRAINRIRSQYHMVK